VRKNQTESLSRDFYAQKGQTSELLRLRSASFSGSDFKLPNVDGKKLFKTVLSLVQIVLQRWI
jgi:hypothetical protein